VTDPAAKPKPKALVIGGAGFIGSHLCDALHAGGQYGMVVPRFVSARLPARRSRSSATAPRRAASATFRTPSGALCGLMEKGTSGEIYNVASTERIRIIDPRPDGDRADRLSSELVCVPYD
jgi:hypothetical protein